MPPTPWGASSSRATRSRTSGPSWGPTPVRSRCRTAPSSLPLASEWRSRAWSWCRCATVRSSWTTCTTTTWASWFSSVSSRRARPRDRVVMSRRHRGGGKERDVMAETRLLERLTASDLFLLLWDDYGWSTDIGGLAILDGASLLDRDGRLRIEAVRRK